MSDLRADCEWPPLEAFYSHLKGAPTCSEEEWRQARDEFYRRRALPPHHPDHFESMADYLKVCVVCVPFPTITS